MPLDIFLIDLTDCALEDDEPQYLLCYHLNSWSVRDGSFRHLFHYPANNEEIIITSEMQDEANIYPLSKNKKHRGCLRFIKRPVFDVVELNVAIARFCEATKLSVALLLGIFDDFISQFDKVQNAPKWKPLR